MNAHPTELVNNLVTLLRGFSGLVTNECDGDQNRVIAFLDAFPGDNFESAVLNATHPSVLVAYMGYGPGKFALNEIMRHELAAFLRPREIVGGASSSAHNMVYEIENGTDANGLTIRRAVIHEACDPIGEDMKAVRVPTAAGVDIWKLQIFLPER